LTLRIVPCLDVRDGRVVKGVRFAGLRDVGSPVELARAYEEQGADEIVFLDVSATPEGRSTAIETVRAVREVLSIPMTVGGGVRTADDARALLEAGADKVSVNTAAVERPELVGEIAERFGAQCAVVAIDAARFESANTDAGAGARTTRRAEGTYEIVTRSGKHRTGIEAVGWARRVAELGAGEILLTSFDRDGTRSGYDLELLAAISEAVRVPIVASGGVDGAEHLLEGARAGADALLAASIFHDGRATVRDVKRYLAEHDVRIRP